MIYITFFYAICVIVNGPEHPTYQARQTRPNSGGVAEVRPRFDKGGVAIVFYLLRVKNRTF